MPKGPKGVKRPADWNAAAVMVGRIATGDVEDKPSKAPGRAAGGTVGGTVRAGVLTPAKRKAIALKGAKARWKD